jgi:hypothetical protein
MHTKVRTTLIGVIAAVGLAAATIPAASQAAVPIKHGVPIGHGGHGGGPVEPTCGPIPC